MKLISLIIREKVNRLTTDRRIKIRLREIHKNLNHLYPTLWEAYKKLPDWVSHFLVKPMENAGLSTALSLCAGTVVVIAALFVIGMMVLLISANDGGPHAKIACIATEEPFRRTPHKLHHRHGNAGSPTNTKAH